LPHLPSGTQRVFTTRPDALYVFPSVRTFGSDQFRDCQRRGEDDPKTGDLRYDAPTLVALKTTPPENPYIWDEPRFQGRDTRTITHWGITPQTGVPMA